jgi:hypothetical protein
MLRTIGVKERKEIFTNWSPQVKLHREMCWKSVVDKKYVKATMHKLGVSSSLLVE